MSESLLEKLLLESRLGELSLDVLPDSLDESLLLRLPLLLLEPNPAVQHRLELGLDGLFLCQSEVLVLDSVGLAGDGVELLSKGDNLLEGLDGVDTLLNGLLVLGLGGVQGGFDSLRVSRASRESDDSTNLDVTLSPGGVGSTGGFGNNGDKDEESNGKNSLLVDDLATSVLPLSPFSPSAIVSIDTHVDLGGHGSGGETGTENETTSLCEERAGWDRVDDRSGLLIRGRFYMSAYS